MRTCCWVINHRFNYFVSSNPDGLANLPGKYSQNFHKLFDI